MGGIWVGRVCVEVGLRRRLRGPTRPAMGQCLCHAPTYVSTRSISSNSILILSCIFHGQESTRYLDAADSYLPSHSFPV